MSLPLPSPLFVIMGFFSLVLCLLCFFFSFDYSSSFSSPCAVKYILLSSFTFFLFPVFSLCSIRETILKSAYFKRDYSLFFLGTEKKNIFFCLDHDNGYTYTTTDRCDWSGINHTSGTASSHSQTVSRLISTELFGFETI